MHMQNVLHSTKYYSQRGQIGYYRNYICDADVI